MKKCLHNLILLLLVAFGHALQAQDRTLGSWQTVPSFSPITHLAGSQNVVFAASQNGLFRHRNGISGKLLDKTSGLSDTGIGDMTYIEETEQLLVGYRSGLIDLISTSEVIQEDAIQSLDPRLQKEIHRVTVHGNMGFFASDLGIITYDLTKAQARDIYRNIGPNAQPISCYALQIRNDTLLAFTEIGLLAGSLNSNLLDFTQWHLVLERPFGPNTVSVLHNEHLIFSEKEDSLFILSGSNQVDTLVFDGPINDLIKSESGALITSGFQLLLLDTGLALSEVSRFDKLVQTALQTNENFWVAFADGELLNINENMSVSYFSPSSDYPINQSKIDDGIQFYYGDVPPLSYSNGSFSVLEFDDPNLNIIDAVEFIDGIIYLDQNLGLLDESLKRLDSQPAAAGQYTDMLINGDQIWVSRSNTTNPVFYTDVTNSFAYAESTTLRDRSVSEIKVSQGSTYYFKTNTNELIAYEPLSKDSRLINEFDGIGGIIADFVIDLNDVIYITSETGLYFFPDATFIFDIEPAFEVFISSGRLLQEDNYNTICIDPGNRKWISTTEGLWLYDEEFDEEISFFTEENSPLPSQKIDKLIFQENNGLLWLLTDKGIASYQTDAAIAQPFHDNVKVFPNPLYLSQNNERLGISGLVQNATVKITTMNGHFIKEIRSNGGVASWDLIDFTGKKAVPGIYLIFSSDQDGIETYVGKFLIEL